MAEQDTTGIIEKGSDPFEEFVQRLFEAAPDGAQAGAAAAKAESPAEEAAQIAEEPVVDEAEALLAQEAEEPKETDPAEDIEARVVEQPKGAQKRIKQLVDQRNEMRTQLAQTQAAFQAQMSQMQAQLAQAQEQSTNYARQQNGLLQKQLDMLSRKATDEQLDKMSPLERHDHELKMRVSSDLETKIHEALAPLKGQLDAERRARAQAEQQMEKQRRFSHYNDLTKKARQEILLNEVDPKAAEPLSEEAEETLLAYAAAYGLEPNQAAPRLKKFLDGYARAYINAKSAAAKAQSTKQQSVPGVARPTAPRGTKPRLTLAEIRKQGFTDFVEYNANQLLEG